MIVTEISRSTITSIIITIGCGSLIPVFSVLLFYTIGLFIENIKEKVNIFENVLLIPIIMFTLTMVFLLSCAILDTWNIFKITVV